MGNIEVFVLPHDLVRRDDLVRRVYRLFGITLQHRRVLKQPPGDRARPLWPQENGMYGKWRKLAWDANLLALESQWVIAMRLAKLSRGGRSASREASRMVTEKLSAMGEAGRKLATGGSGHSVIKQYRRKVRSNLRRLKK